MNDHYVCISNAVINWVHAQKNVTLEMASVLLGTYGSNMLSLSPDILAVSS